MVLYLYPNLSGLIEILIIEITVYFIIKTQHNEIF